MLRHLTASTRTPCSLLGALPKNTKDIYQLHLNASTQKEFIVTAHKKNSLSQLKNTSVMTVLEFCSVAVEIQKIF